VIASTIPSTGMIDLRPDMKTSTEMIIMWGQPPSAVRRAQRSCFLL
jgi:hypothetical protein